MFVKFSCGCLGLVGIPGEDDQAVVLQTCALRSEDCHEPIVVYRRDLSDQTHEPLYAEQAVKLLTEIGKLVAEGYALRQIRAIIMPRSRFP
jgi:hypothetical protein